MISTIGYNKYTDDIYEVVKWMSFGFYNIDFDNVSFITTSDYNFFTIFDDLLTKLKIQCTLKHSDSLTTVSYGESKITDSISIFSIECNDGTIENKNYFYDNNVLQAITTKSSIERYFNYSGYEYIAKKFYGVDKQETKMFNSDTGLITFKENKINGRVVYTYDDDLRLIKKDFIDRKCCFKYLYEKTMVREIITVKGKTRKIETITYDNNHNIVLIDTTYRYHDFTKAKKISVFRYNNDGLVIKKQEDIIDHKWVYNKNKQLKRYLIKMNGSCVEEHSFEYDSIGRLERIKDVTTSGHNLLKIVYKANDGTIEKRNINSKFDL